MAWRWLWTVPAILALTAGATAVAYRQDLRRIRAEVAAGSRMIDTFLGPVEVAERGQGPAVLVLHGAGGGYDQGLLLADRIGGAGYRWIAVSRFGYLRSPLPAEASTAAQADALAALLDALGIDRVAVLAMSGGVPPALQLAAHHPERVQALVLLSAAPYTPMTADAQDLPMPAWAYRALFASDFPFWLMVRLWPARLDAVFDVTVTHRATMDAADRQAVARLVVAFLPVTPRLAGLANEGAAIEPSARYDLRAIRAPTLVIHARDDGINPFPIGTATARDIPGARFLPLDTGGHLLLGTGGRVRGGILGFLAAAGLPPAED